MRHELSHANNSHYGMIGASSKRYGQEAGLPTSKGEVDAELGSGGSSEDEEDGEGPKSIIIDNISAPARILSARANNYSPRPSKVPPPIVPPLRLASPSTTQQADNNKLVRQANPANVKFTA